MIAWLPFLVRVIQIYVVHAVPGGGTRAARGRPALRRVPGPAARRSRSFLTIFGGAGLIANDLRTGAILVYLSRPLTRRDYVRRQARRPAGSQPLRHAPPRPAAVRDRPRPGPRAVPEVGAGLDRARGDRAVAGHLARDQPGGAGRVVALQQRAGGGPRVLRPRHGPGARARHPARALRPAGGAAALAPGEPAGGGQRALRHPDRALDTCPGRQPAILLALACLGCLAVLRSRVRAVEIVR